MIFADIVYPDHIVVKLRMFAIPVRGQILAIKGTREEDFYSPSQAELFKERYEGVDMVVDIVSWEYNRDQPKEGAIEYFKANMIITLRK